MAGKHYDLDINAELGGEESKDYYIPSQKAVKTYVDTKDNGTVHKTGTETITGNKTFSGSLSLGSSATATTQSSSDNSTKVATTAFVKSVTPTITFRDWSRNS